MAENEQHFTTTSEKFYLNGQIEHAIASLMCGLKIYPDNIAMQNLLQQYQDIKVLKIPDYIQQENEEIKQNKVQKENKFDHITDTYKTEENIEKNGNDSEIEQKLHVIVNNSFQMRLKVLKMELKVVETFSSKGLIVNENDMLNNIETSMGLVYDALNFSNHEKAENELLKAENFSYQVMRQIKMVVKKRTLKKEEVQKPEDDIEVPDYRSMVTVRGTTEDVTNCILKAKRALENNKYDRAERLLLKAERIFPTKNARDLLKQVRAAEKPTLTTDRIEKATKAVEQVNNFKAEEPKSEGTSTNADKCLTAFEKAFSTGNFEKAVRMLHKAKRFEPSLDLDVEKKLSQVKAAIANKIIEDQRKEEIEKAKRECNTAGECLYKSLKAYDAGDFLNAEQYLLRAKSIDPILNLEIELSAIATKIDSKTSKENKGIDETGPVSESDKKYASGYLYTAKLAYDAGDFKTALQKFYSANTFDKSLYLEPYLSRCRAEIASRSSTEGNTAIANKVPDTVTTTTKENVGSSQHYFKEAQIACQNKNLNETKRLLTLAKSHYSCPDANVMLEYIEEKYGKNQPKLSYDITTSEIQFSCLEDEKQKEVEMQLERQKREMIDKEKSKIKKNNEPELRKLFEGQQGNLEHTDRGYTSGKDNKEKTLNKTKLQEVERIVKQARHCISKGELEYAKVALQKAQSIHATSTVKSLMEQVEKDLDNLNNYSSKRNADLKTTIPLPKKEQVKNLISMAEKDIQNKKFQAAMNFLNTAEELHPTDRAKELLKNISKILFSPEETHVHLNCYEFPIEVNESNKTEALKCIRMAQAAFQEDQYDRAEHLLLKSLRICDSPKAKSFLKTVRDAKAHYNSKTKTEKSYNAHINYQSVGDKINEYNKCIDVATKASAEGNIDKAERFLLKAIRFNPNDDAQKQLQHIQGVRASQSHHSRDDIISDVDLKQKKETNMFINRAIDATSRRTFDVARFYFECAYEIQPNELTWELLQNVRKQIERSKKAGHYIKSKFGLMMEANKLLVEIEYLINSGNLEEVESLLTISWDMNRSRRTTFILKKFLEARLTRGVGDCDNIFESDKLVELALDVYKNNKLEEAEKLLMKASAHYRSGIIDRLLVEIKEAKTNTTFGNVKNYIKKIF